MARELVVQYNQARSGGVQFSDRVRVTSLENFQSEVINRIDNMVGRDDVFDLKITTSSGVEVISHAQGLPVNLISLITAAFNSSDLF